MNNLIVVLFELILNEIKEIDWDKWSVWLLEFVCRCVKLVYEKSYNVFGVYLYGMFFVFFISSYFLFICYMFIKEIFNGMDLNFKLRIREEGRKVLVNMFFLSMLFLEC